MRRGALLLETLLALALFVGAAGYTLVVLRDAIASTDRLERRAEALDLAGSRLAAIEAGIVSINAQEDIAEEVLEETQMQVEVSVSRSAINGLSRVEVRVLDLREEMTGEPTILARLATLLPEEAQQ